MARKEVSNLTDECECIVPAIVAPVALVLFRAKVVPLTKKSYQFVLSLQGAQPRKVEKSYQARKS